MGLEKQVVRGHVKLKKGKEKTKVLYNTVRRFKKASTNRLVVERLHQTNS